MPTMRTYIVTETRKVQVTANSAGDAIRLADKAFKASPDELFHNGGLRTKEGLEGVWGDTGSAIRQTSLFVEEIR